MTRDDPGLVLDAVDAQLRELRATGPVETDEVATLLLRRANALLELGQSADALAGYSEFLATVGERAFDKQAVVSALFQRATLLQGVGRFEDALHGFDDVVELATEPLPALPYIVIEALWGRAVNLQQLGRDAEAITALEFLVESFAEDERTILLDYVAQSMIARAWLFEQAGDLETSLAEFNEMIGRFADIGDAGIQGQVADARVRRAQLLSRLGLSDEASDSYDEVLVRPGDVNDDATVRALYGKARELALLGRDSEALAAIDALLLRLRTTSSEAAATHALMALHVRARLLVRNDELDELAGVAHALIDRVGAADERGPVDPAFQGAVAALMPGLILGQQWATAIAVCDALLARMARSPDSDSGGLVALALADKALALAELGRSDEATVVRESVLALGDPPLPGLDDGEALSGVDAAPAGDEGLLVSYSRAVVLEQLDYTEEAIRAFSELVAHCKTRDAPLAQRIAADAHDRCARLKHDG
jgi:tetratricopeptide (TPR) repeat protein